MEETDEEESVGLGDDPRSQDVVSCYEGEHDNNSNKSGTDESDDLLKDDGDVEEEEGLFLDDDDVQPEATGATTEATEATDDEYNPREPIGDIDLEIVGLLSSSNGRSCSCHPVCGESVVVGDVLRLVRTVVSVNGRVEPAVKLVKVTDGFDGCSVAFIPRIQMNLPKVIQNITKFCIVKELYSDSVNNYKRALSHKNAGMAGVVLLELIPMNE
jgi:hypothetical protein